MSGWIYAAVVVLVVAAACGVGASGMVAGRVFLRSNGTPAHDRRPVVVWLLVVLAAEAGRVVSRDALAQAVGPQKGLHARSVDVYIARLRRLREPTLRGKISMEKPKDDFFRAARVPSTAPALRSCHAGLRNHRRTR